MSCLRPVLYALCLLVAGQSSARAYDGACSPDDVILGSTPAPPQTPDTQRAFTRQMSRFARPSDFVLIGDSLTARWSADALSGLRPASVLNLGIEGDGVQHVLWRLAHYPLTDLSPRIATLLIGTNNLGVGNRLCVLEIGLDKLLVKLAQTWPATEVLLFGIPRRGPALDFREADRLAANRYMRDRALASRHIHYVDLDTPLACPTAAGCAFYDPDMLHLAAPAYGIMTESVRQAAAPRH